MFSEEIGSHPYSLAAADGTAGDLRGLGFGAVVEGSGLAHASFDPQASVLENAEKADVLL